MIKSSLSVNCNDNHNAIENEYDRLKAEADNIRIIKEDQDDYVIKYYDVCEKFDESLSENVIFIFMERCELSLEDFISNKLKLEAKKCVNWINQLFRGAQSIISKGIIMQIFLQGILWYATIH